MDETEGCMERMVCQTKGRDEIPTCPASGILGTSGDVFSYLAESEKTSWDVGHFYGKSVKMNTQSAGIGVGMGGWWCKLEVEVEERTL